MNYYYFVASLPELRLDDYKGPYRVGEFILELDDFVSVSHRQLIEDLLCLYDNMNLIDVLMRQDFNLLGEKGRWEKEELQARLTEAEPGLCRYMEEFLADFKEGSEGKEGRAGAEHDLLSRFYAQMLRHENRFVREYFRFDLELRNILLGLNARRFGVRDVRFVEPEENDGDLVTHRLKNSPLSDFGLSGERPYMSRLVDVFGRGDLVATEKFIDQLRWDKIDELNTFCYFGVEVLLGFLLKLMIVERWIGLDPKKGRRVLEERLTIEKNKEKEELVTSEASW